MIDRYTKILLTVIAISLTVIVGYGAIKTAIPEVVAQIIVPVKVVQGQSLHEAWIMGART